jgi:putative addiction module component (TIGR02574 family)
VSPGVSDLLKRALSLPVDERAALANTLLDSLDQSNDQAEDSVEEAWGKEVARRMKNLEGGRAVTVLWDELHAKLLTMRNDR